MKNAKKVRAGRIGLNLTIALGAALALTIPLWRMRSTARITELPPAKATPAGPESVEADRSGDIPEGFRGEVHPVLHGQTSLEVAAHWSSLGQGKEQLERRIPASVYSLFMNLRAAVPIQVYTERAFSVLMPESVGSVGQIWEIDRDDVGVFLRQFHPRPTLHLVSSGRRAGPDGAFALLRAVSPTHLDVVFRIHAEFDIAQNVWLTPACFWGRMIVDKSAGTVAYFRLWVPTENRLNVHLTVAESVPKGGTEPVLFREIEQGDVVYSKRDIVRVERMELVSANQELPEALDWSSAIDMDEARLKLKQAFYAFANIDWVPWQRAQAAAVAAQKPILAVVLWGALDDQSC
jgi:hypothetical protein